MPRLDSLRLIGSGESNRAMEAEFKRLCRRQFDDFRDVTPKRADPQTLVYPFSPRLAWLAVNYLRTPSRALQDLFETKAARLEPLYDDVRKWMVTEDRDWLKDGLGLSIRARDIAEFPASRTQIQGTIKNAIIEAAQERGIEVHLQADEPDILLSVRGSQRGLIISIDLAGRSLHERGYRHSRVLAPIRENIAAQILMLARWDSRSEILFDPMCGSGTFLIEGACMARAMPLWTGDNRPAADNLKIFEAFEHDFPPLFEDTQAALFGNDIETHAIKASKQNAHRAQVKGIRFACEDFESIDPKALLELSDPERELDTQKGLIVCNPPYGERIEADTKELAQRMGQWFTRFGAGWRAAVIVADPEFDDFIPFKRIMKKPMANASINATLLIYDLGIEKAEDQEIPRMRENRKSRGHARKQRPNKPRT